MKNGSQFVEEFVAQAELRLNENTAKLGKCLAELSEEEVWKTPNDSSNSVGNLVLHLCGNITQYIMSALGGEEDLRDRDAEFSARGTYTRTQLFQKISGVVEQAISVMQRQEIEEFTRHRRVQGFDLSGIAIIMHVVEHYSYHTGQIIYWTKLLKDKDLGFYSGVDLNRTGDE